MDKKFWLLVLGAAWSIQAKDVYVFKRVTTSINPKAYTFTPKAVDAQGKVPVEYGFDEYSMQRGHESYQYRCMIAAKQGTMIDFYDEKNVLRINAPMEVLKANMPLVGICNLSKKYTMQITTKSGISPYEYYEVQPDSIKFLKESDLTKTYEICAVQGSKNKETGAKLSGVSMKALEREGLTMVFIDVDYKMSDFFKQKPTMKIMSWRDGFKKYGSFLKGKKNILELVAASDISCASMR
jgi:hypothetical protein